jgi:hypothetical protein
LLAVVVDVSVSMLQALKCVSGKVLTDGMIIKYELVMDDIMALNEVFQHLLVL